MWKESNRKSGGRDGERGREDPLVERERERGEGSERNLCGKVEREGQERGRERPSGEGGGWFGGVVGVKGKGGERR